jgi:SAM-dependent methyltransferase
MGNVELLIRSMKKRGLINTLRYVTHELIFDWANNTDTKPELANYDPVNDRPETLVGPYLGANPYIVKQCIAKCSQLGLEICKASFLDIGAGKGRVMLLAALYGFKKVIGVELDANLCLVARRNLEINKGRIKYCNYDVCNEDAANYVFPENLNVVFMYNTFGTQLMREVLKKLTAKPNSHAQSMRHEPLYIIYLNPIYAKVFVKFGLTPLVNVKHEALIYRID